MAKTTNGKTIPKWMEPEEPTPLDKDIVLNKPDWVKEDPVSIIPDEERVSNLDELIGRPVSDFNFKAIEKEEDLLYRGYNRLYTIDTDGVRVMRNLAYPAMEYLFNLGECYSHTWDVEEEELLQLGSFEELAVRMRLVQGVINPGFISAVESLAVTAARILDVSTPSSFNKQTKTFSLSFKELYQSKQSYKLGLRAMAEINVRGKQTDERFRLDEDDVFALRKAVVIWTYIAGCIEDGVKDVLAHQNDEYNKSILHLFSMEDIVSEERHMEHLSYTDRSLGIDRLEPVGSDDVEEEEKYRPELHLDYDSTSILPLLVMLVTEYNLKNPEHLVEVSDDLMSDMTFKVKDKRITGKAAETELYLKHEPEGRITPTEFKVKQLLQAARKFNLLTPLKNSESEFLPFDNETSEGFILDFGSSTSVNSPMEFYVGEGRMLIPHIRISPSIRKKIIGESSLYNNTAVAVSVSSTWDDEVLEEYMEGDYTVSGSDERLESFIAEVRNHPDENSNTMCNSVVCKQFLGYRPIGTQEPKPSGVRRILHTGIRMLLKTKTPRSGVVNENLKETTMTTKKTTKKVKTSKKGSVSFTDQLAGIKPSVKTVSPSASPAAEAAKKVADNKAKAAAKAKASAEAAKKAAKNLEIANEAKAKKAAEKAALAKTLAAEKAAKEEALAAEKASKDDSLEKFIADGPESLTWEPAGEKYLALVSNTKGRLGGYSHVVNNGVVSRLYIHVTADKKAETALPSGLYSIPIGDKRDLTDIKHEGGLSGKKAEALGVYASEKAAKKAALANTKDAAAVKTAVKAEKRKSKKDKAAEKFEAMKVANKEKELKLKEELEKMKLDNAKAEAKAKEKLEKEKLKLQEEKDAANTSLAVTKHDDSMSWTTPAGIAAGVAVVGGVLKYTNLGGAVLASVGGAWDWAAEAMSTTAYNIFGWRTGKYNSSYYSPGAIAERARERTTVRGFIGGFFSTLAGDFIGNMLKNAVTFKPWVEVGPGTPTAVLNETIVKKGLTLMGYTLPRWMMIAGPLAMTGVLIGSIANLGGYTITESWNDMRKSWSDAWEAVFGPGLAEDATFLERTTHAVSSIVAKTSIALGTTVITGCVFVGTIFNTVVGFIGSIVGTVLGWVADAITGTLDFIFG